MTHLMLIVFLLFAGLPSLSMAGVDTGRILEQESYQVTTATGEEVTVLRGRLEVPENRRDGSSRRITLPFYRWQTQAAQPGPPMFVLAGGPGTSGLRQFTQAEPFAAARFFHQFGDVVVFDQRGTGGAEPNLRCPDENWGIPLTEPADGKRLSQLFVETVSACQTYWRSQGVDLSAYNTDENAADVDALRRALGYDTINLFGGSYGSHLGLHLLRRFPKSINRAVFYGIEGPDDTYDIPSKLTEVHRLIAAELETNPALKKRLPKGGLLAVYAGVIQRLRENPVQTEVTHKGQTYQVWVTAPLAQAAMRGAGSLKNPMRWPESILALAEGNYKDAARIALSLQQTGGPNLMKYTMDLSSGCSQARMRQISEDPDAVLYPMMNVEYRAMAPVLEVNDLGPAFRKPVTAKHPVLLIHGTWDTSTPLENAQAVAAALPNATLLTVVRGNHGAFYNLFTRFEPFKSELGAFLQGKPARFPKKIALPGPTFAAGANSAAQAQLWDACRSGNLTAAKRALAKGADLRLLDTRKSRSGRRALNWAAWFNHPDLVRWLLDQGVAIDAVNRTGFTALHHAVENGSREAFDVLLAAGADASVANRHGATPLQTAQRLKRTAFVRSLQR